MCKVCVAIFVFLSGYGLYKSFTKYISSKPLTIKNTLKFTFLHLKKLLTGYWWAVVPFAILGMTTGMRSYQTIYGSGKSSILYLVIDILGLGGRFDMNRMYNITCWYIALAIGLYITFPFIYALLKKNVILFCGFSLFIAFMPFPSVIFESRIWLCPFALGMLFADKNLMDKIAVLSKNAYSFFGASCALIGSAFLRLHCGLIADCVFSVSIIAFCVILFSNIPKVFGIVFDFLGKHSANIFMTHTFFFSYFWKNFFYSPKHPLLVFLLLLSVCLGYSVVLSKIKSLLSRLFSLIRKKQKA